MAYPLGDDVSGLLSIENGVGTIGYNQTEPKVRKRFTIAHELGHFELHRDKSDLFVDKQFIYRSQNSGNNPIIDGAANRKFDKSKVKIITQPSN